MLMHVGVAGITAEGKGERASVKTSENTEADTDLGQLPECQHNEVWELR